MRQRSNLILVFGVAFFVIGGAIVFLVLNDDDDGGGGTASSTAPVDVTVLVAATDIPPNTLGRDVIEGGMLTTKQIPARERPSGALTTAAGLENQIFVASVPEGETITSAQLTVRSLSNIQVPDGFDAVAITVPFINGGGGYIAPGDSVNVYGLYGSSDGAAGLTAVQSGSPLPRTELALTNIVVLDVSNQATTSFQQQGGQQVQASDSPNQTQASRPSGSEVTFLLALRPTDAERLVQLSEFGDLYFALTADEAPPAGDTPGIDGSSVNSPVSADSAAPREG